MVAALTQVVEPNTLGLARDDVDAAALIGRVTRVMSKIDGADPAGAYFAFLSAFGSASQATTLSAMDLRCIEASLREPLPWEATLSPLTRQDFPVLIMLGGWPGKDALVRSTGRAFRAVGERLSQRLGGELVTFENSFHNPQLAGAPFNRRLEEFLRAAGNRHPRAAGGHEPHH